jgi:hypothetical protein
MEAIFGKEFLEDFKRNRPAAFIDLMIAFESRNGNRSNDFKVCRLIYIEKT